MLREDARTIRLLEPRPYDSEPLRWHVDLSQMRAAFARPSRALRIDARGPRDFQTFRTAVNDGVAVVHFDGHARRLGSTLYLVFEDHNDGTSQDAAFGTALQEIEARAGNPLLLCLSACAVLRTNECEQARQCTGLAALVAFVCPDEPPPAEQITVGTDDAADFFRAFYGELAGGCTVMEAYDVACSGRAAGRRRSGVQPLIIAREPSWRLFEPGKIPWDDVRWLVDSACSLPKPGHVQLPSFREKAIVLHTKLMSPGREQAPLAIVGPHDSGRSLVVSNVAARVAWRFRSVVELELGPSSRLTAESLARLVLRKACVSEQGLPSAASAPTWEPAPTASRNLSELLRAELGAPALRGILLILQVDSPKALAEDAWALLGAARPPSVVLVIGPRRLRALGWPSVPMAPLDRHEACMLFVGSIPAASDRREIVAEAQSRFHRIYAQLGGHPLALVTAARTLGSFADVRRLAATGSAFTRRTRWLDRTLASVRRNSKALRTLRALALFVGPVPCQTAVGIMRQAVPGGWATAAQLGWLVDRGWLEREESELGGEQAVRVHGTLRRALLQRAGLSPADEFAVLQAAAGAPGARWQGVWHESLLAWAARLSEGDVRPVPTGRLAKKVVKLVGAAYDAEVRSLNLEWNHALAAEALQRHAEFLVVLGDERSAACQRLDAVECLLRHGEIGHAKTIVARIVSSQKAEPVRVRALRCQGIVCRLEGDVQRARHLLRRALGASSDQCDTADCYRALAEVEREAGQFGLAVQFLEHARGVLDGGGKDVARTLARVLDREGYVYQLLRQDGRAIECYEAALDLLVEQDPEYVRVRIACGDVYANGRQWEAAEQVLRRCVKQAKALATQPGRPSGGGWLLAAEAASRLARARRKRRDPPAVSDAIQQAKMSLRASLLSTPSSRYRVVRVLIELAEAAAFFAPTVAERLLEGVGAQASAQPGESTEHAMVLRARALIAQHRATSGELSYGVAAEAFEQAAGAFLQAGHAWRAARCRLRAVECLGAAGGSSAPERWGQALASSTQLAQEFADMGDCYRQERAAGYASELQRRLSGSGGGSRVHEGARERRTGTT